MSITHRSVARLLYTIPTSVMAEKDLYGKWLSFGTSFLMTLLLIVIDNEYQVIKGVLINLLSSAPNWVISVIRYIIFFMLGLRA